MKDFFFAYVLEYMLTFDKIQNTSPLMCTKFEIGGQSILKVILNIGCSGPAVKCLDKLDKINMLQPTTRPLTHCIYNSEYWVFWSSSKVSK